MDDFKQKFVLALLAYAVQRGLSAQRLCELTAIDFPGASKKKATVPSAAEINNLWKNAAYLSNDELFGLHFGESMQLPALGIIGQMVQTSNTVGDALSNAASLTHVLTDMFDMKIVRMKNTFKIVLFADEVKARQYPYTYRHMGEYLMVFVVHELDGLVLERIEPIAVNLPYFIKHDYEYSRVFRNNVTRKNNEMSLEFRNKILDTNVLSANYELQNILLKQVSALQNGRRSNGSLQARVYNFLISNSYMRPFSQDAVAANFNLSPRTLQRKLKDEGVTYQEIAEEVRETLAKSYLSQSQYQIKDIAYILGYNELSSFIKAFKRWTSKTPTEFQQAHHVNARKVAS